MCNDTQFGCTSWFCIFKSGYALGRKTTEVILYLLSGTGVSLTSTGDTKFGRMVKVMSSGFLHCKATNFSLCNFVINKYIMKKLFWHYILFLIKLSPILNCFIIYWKFLTKTIIMLVIAKWWFSNLSYLKMVWNEHALYSR